MKTCLLAALTALTVSLSAQETAPAPAAAPVVEAATPSEPAVDPAPAPTPTPAVEEQGLSFTLNGKTYHDVHGAEVTLEKIRFRHRDGVESISWADMPDNLAKELKIHRPGATEKAKGFFEELTVNEKIGLGLAALGLLISFLGGLMFLVRAWRISFFWFLAVLLPAVMAGLLFQGYIFPILQALGFPDSSSVIPLICAVVFGLFFWLLGILCIGWLTWKVFSANGSVPTPLLALLAAYIPGAALVFTNTDKMFKPVAVQILGLLFMIGGGFYLSERLKTWQETTLHAPARPAVILEPAPAAPPAPAAQPQ